jgi:hypothetical protein
VARSRQFLRKWKIHDLDPYFWDNYYLLKNKKNLTDVKQHLTGLNFLTKVTELPLLWQQ